MLDRKKWQLAKEHSGAFKSQRARYFPQEVVETKNRAKNRVDIGLFFSGKESQLRRNTIVAPNVNEQQFNTAIYLIS